MERIGLVAGNGRLPILFAERVRQKGHEVVAVALEDEASPELERHVAQMHWACVARLGRIIDILKREGVKRAVFAGGVRKASMYERVRTLRFRPDWRAVKVWYRKTRDKNDHTLLGAVADEFESEGIKIVSVLDYLSDITADEGCMTRRKPSRRELDDIEFAWEIAKRIAEMQVGQTLVVKERCVVAVEAVEGTDEAIRRGGALAQGGAVVVKLARPNQDFRFDIPTIGPRTIDTLREAKISTLAIEAGRTLMLDKDELLARANEHDITIYGRR